MSYELGVVMPTRNRAAMLEHAIASVPRDVEVVVVDDASSDSTSSVLVKLGDRIRHTRMVVSGGPCAARNAGVMLSTADRILFLDDDDVMLPGATELIRAACADTPDTLLHMFNCEWSDGATSVEPTMPTMPIDYRRWLGGEFSVELKPVVHRDLFAQRQFEDTGAGGEGLLWGQVIRDLGALAVGSPIVRYNVGHAERLTSPSGLLERSELNAAIADRWLELFGADQRRYAPRAWHSRVMAAAFYHAVSGHRPHVLRLAQTQGLATHDRAAITALVAMPRPALRTMFRIRSRLSGAPQRR